MKKQFIHSFFLICAFVFSFFVVSASAQSLDEAGGKTKEQLIDDVVKKVDDCFGFFGWRCQNKQELITLSQAYITNLKPFCSADSSTVNLLTPCGSKQQATCANLSATLLMLVAVLGSAEIEYERKSTIRDLSRWMHQLSQSVRDLKKECYDQPGALYGWEPVER